MGLQLFKGDTVNKEHSFCLFRCFTHLKKEQDITFTDSSIERILDIKMLLPFEGKNCSRTGQGIVECFSVKGHWCLCSATCTCFTLMFCSKISANSFGGAGGHKTSQGPRHTILPNFQNKKKTSHEIEKILIRNKISPSPHGAPLDAPMDPF